jgi:hypothetical protein
MTQITQMNRFQISDYKTINQELETRNKKPVSFIRISTQ